MTITFKQFLSEEAVKQLPDFEQVKTKKAIKMLNEHCKDALWMLTENKPFYRGEKGLPKGIAPAGFVSVDPSKTERSSQNTSNYYTMILDSNPYCKDFPKRSRSFIGTTIESRANSFGGWGSGKFNAVFVMIPYDGVKIGAVGRDDMWDTRISLFGKNRGISDFNDNFDELGLEPKLKDFEKYGKRLADDVKAREYFKRNGFPQASDAQMKDFMGTIWKAYGPESTKHKAFTTASLPHSGIDGEVWVGGPVMYISLAMWKALRMEVKK